MQQSLFMEDAPRIPARGGATRIRYFNGTTRRTSDWDGLRRDSHLWFEEANCLVYFYSEKSSQRGASLKIPFEAVSRLRCNYLSNRCLRISSGGSRSEGTYTRLLNDSDPKTAKYELYIPAPSGLTREQAFVFHLTTRNLIAYTVGGALVGEKLSSALVDLWKRVREWDIPLSQTDFTTYLEKQGYLDFTENTEHSLACLKLSEYARLRDVWMDSFVHCVGMHARLDLSPEFGGVSNATIALVTRKSLEMDCHIDRAVRALGSFLEDDFGPEQIGLSKPAREHLDYFRSFLHTFYVNKFGYFPPRASIRWNKRPWTSMYHDFQKLYDYLADTHSSSDWTANGGVTGGVCVAQNVQSFDLRHGYPALQHPLPLLPQLASKHRYGIGTPKGLLPLARSKMHMGGDAKTMASQNLAAAANTSEDEVTRCPLVQEYQRFEQGRTVGKLSLVEARKVRWLLIYGILQRLSSVIKAPAEVRDPETPSYPLCVSTVGCPPWEKESHLVSTSTEAQKQSSNEKVLVPQALEALEGRTSRISIHPDCEADCAEDFFASMNATRQDSLYSSSAPLSPIKRSASFRNSMQSSVQALQKSVVGSFGKGRGSLERRNTTRRSSLIGASTTPKTERVDLRKSRSVCEIIVKGNDQATQAAQSHESRQIETVSSGLMEISRTKNAFLDFDFGFSTRQQPILEESQGECMASEPSDESGESTAAPSNRSSIIVDNAESPTTDLSSFDGGSRRGSNASNASISQEVTASNKQNSYQPSNPVMNQKASRTDLDAGTYVPKGMVSKSSSTGSASSTGSSVFAPAPLPTKIKESRSKEGRRSRGLSELSSYGIVLGKENVW